MKDGGMDGGREGFVNDILKEGTDIWSVSVETIKALPLQ